VRTTLRIGAVAAILVVGAVAFATGYWSRPRLEGGPSSVRIKGVVESSVATGERQRLCVRFDHAAVRPRRNQVLDPESSDVGVCGYVVQRVPPGTMVEGTLSLEGSGEGKRTVWTRLTAEAPR
jgi:hypothetical protein